MVWLKYALFDRAGAVIPQFSTKISQTSNSCIDLISFSVTERFLLEPLIFKDIGDYLPSNSRAVL